MSTPLPPPGWPDVERIDEEVEDYLRTAGDVFAAFRLQDSGCTSYGVAVGEERFFVKCSSVG